MGNASKVTVKLPPALATHAGAREVSVQGANVLAAIRDLDRVQPSLSDGICNELDAQRPHVLIFVDDTEIRFLKGLRTPLKGGETILIMPAVSGG
ncbi:MAG: MoaD/ThiS family protein [Planctomycetes bacterium]|nr:MoaD/ThiS family protein [Planctomycetota bacterium]